MLIEYVFLDCTIMSARCEHCGAPIVLRALGRLPSADVDIIDLKAKMCPKHQFDDHFIPWDFVMPESEGVQHASH